MTCWSMEPLVVSPGKRLVRGLSALAPPPADEIDDLLRDEYLALLVILRGSEISVRVGAADVDHGRHEVDVAQAPLYYHRTRDVPC